MGSGIADLEGRRGAWEAEEEEIRGEGCALRRIKSPGLWREKAVLSYRARDTSEFMASMHERMQLQLHHRPPKFVNYPVRLIPRGEDSNRNLFLLSDMTLMTTSHNQ